MVLKGPHATTFKMPDSVTDVIISELKRNETGCSGTAELFSEDYIETPEGNFLILIGLPDYLCTMSNTFIPVTVSPGGEWRTGNPVKGAPSIIKYGKDTRIWMVTQWQIEGTYPELMRSRDGIHWESVPLPAARNVDCCFERITDIVFKESVIQLTFHGDSENKTEVWECNVASGNTLKPLWKQSDEPVNTVKTEGLRQDPGDWLRFRSLETNEIMFKQSGSSTGLTVIIPASIRFPNQRSR